jgi:hypothetical protein
MLRIRIAWLRSKRRQAGHAEPELPPATKVREPPYRNGQVGINPDRIEFSISLSDLLHAWVNIRNISCSLAGRRPFGFAPNALVDLFEDRHG